VNILQVERQRIDRVRGVVQSHELATGFSEGKMARASVAPDPYPCPDGDVAGRAHLRFAFAMADRRQRHGPIIILCDPFRSGDRVAGGADRPCRLEWDQERKAGLENWVVSHGAQSLRYLTICC